MRIAYHLRKNGHRSVKTTIRRLKPPSVGQNRHPSVKPRPAGTRRAVSAHTTIRRSKPPSVGQNRHPSVKTAIRRSKPPSVGQKQRGYGNINGGTDTARRVPARTAGISARHHTTSTCLLPLIFPYLDVYGLRSLAMLTPQTNPLHHSSWELGWWIRIFPVLFFCNLGRRLETLPR
jgi:hypothetical protein